MIVLSLGGGVQSTTVALMGLHGELQIDHAIFADTQDEPAAVYAHLDWLESELAGCFPIHRVTVGALMGRQYRPGRKFTTIPYYLKQANGKRGKLPRQCTADYKLTPIRRKVRELNGGGKNHVRQLIGISLDECHRMKPSGVRYITNEYPLVDRRMSRHDCLLWLARHGYAQPPKSACKKCPFHRDSYWRWLRDTSPAEFEEACDYDDGLRDGRVAFGKEELQGIAYLHDSLIPLRQVDLSTERDWGQEELFGEECEGLCGV